MSVNSARRARLIAALPLFVAAVSALSAAPAAQPADLAPVPRAALRIQAVATLSGGGAVPMPCLSPIVQSARQDSSRALGPVKRALAALGADPSLSGERRVVDADGNVVRFASDRAAFDRLDPTDDDGNNRPDVVDAALGALARSSRLLVTQLELPSPGPVEVIIARLGSGVEGFVTSTRDGRAQIWIDAAPHGGPSGLRRAVAHQYGHAVAAAVGLDPSWGEALATWATMTIDGTPDDRTTSSLAHRLQALDQGLKTDDLDLSAGNAAWLAFLGESFGSTAVKLAVEELGLGGPADAALDRAIRRSGGESLDAALRDFQLWALLVGPRDDHRHFTFASRMGAPTFASVAEALPALSIQSDPDVAPLGMAAVLLRPGERTGGLALRFEGDVAARWSADVLLVRTDGSMQRVPVALDAEGAGALTLPVADLREAILLIRNLDPEGRAARRYSWSALYEPGYPAEISAVRVELAGERGGTLVSWDTARETGTIGFNVLRAPADGGPSTRINPVWIPAIGDAATPAGYSFLDAHPEPGVAYRYRIEAITADGLSSRTDAVPGPVSD